MNTTTLKRFAQDARKQLIGIVSQKIEYVLTQDTPELRDSEKQLRDLKEEIKKYGKEGVVERVAYIWFNRLTALRFMDVNSYNTPMIVTPADGDTLPQILKDAKGGHIAPELTVDRRRLNDLLDGKTAVNDPQNEAYRLLLIAACNHLNGVMPLMFERIQDYTELLMPDDLLSRHSIVNLIREEMHTEDCTNEEVIGWLYQFYISEKKDQVFAGLKKNQKITPANIPAATQLFTPRWIVRYLVENTLGKLWVEMRPDTKLQERMTYFLEDAPQEAVVKDLPSSVTEIRFLDPCMGSGHILVYAFELFTAMYEEEGYQAYEIPELILKHNLYGLDIDERATQLAYFALMMKARGYYKRFLKQTVEPQVMALRNIGEETIKIGVKLPLTVNGKIMMRHEELALWDMTRAENFGSLIRIPAEEAAAITVKDGSIYSDTVGALQRQAEMLSGQYHCVVTNPPYMGGKGMNEELRCFVAEKFPNGKSDLFACFIERVRDFTRSDFTFGLVTMESWMFLSSLENLRKRLLEENSIQSLTHFGWHIMRIAFGTCAFVLKKIKPTENTAGTYSYLEIEDIDSETFTPIVFPKTDNGRYSHQKQKDFALIPGSPIAYWVSEEMLRVFKDCKRLDEYAEVKHGLSTGDNNKLLRSWSEVSYKDIGFGVQERQKAISGSHKWFPYNKGGAFRKWYGNQEYVIRYDEYGVKLMAKLSGHRHDGKSHYFRKGITWSFISSRDFSCRYIPEGFVFDVQGSSLFSEKVDIQYVIALLNSRLMKRVLEIINPTLSFQVGNIASLPLKQPTSNEIIETLMKLSNKCIELAKEDWNSRENSWYFTESPIVSNNSNGKLHDAYTIYTEKGNITLNELRESETAINRMVDELYSITEGSEPEVASDKLTIFQREVSIDENGKPFFKKQEVISQFLSYSVGCMFGRYSLDKPGLILANQGDTITEYLKQVPEPKFMPYEDNVIPVLDEEYFDDDIAGRFGKFLKASFGEEHYEENRAFIEEALGKDIRKHFAKDFYNDHIQRYKKRPIYWMFSSPKGHFKALVYMHRYHQDTVSKVLNEYLRNFIRKLEALRDNYETTGNTEQVTSREKAQAAKKVQDIGMMLKDVRAYEKTMYETAMKRIAIDLDDGVKVNYTKLKDVLVPIKGLDNAED